MAGKVEKLTKVNKFFLSHFTCHSEHGVLSQNLPRFFKTLY